MRDKVHLSKKEAAAICEQLKSASGKVTYNRLTQIVALSDDTGNVPLKTVLDTLYPELPQDKALSSFRQFRHNLADIANAEKIQFSLEVDTNKHKDTKDRLCRFEGEDKSIAIINAYSEQETAGTIRSAQELKRISDKLPLKYFISYAHKDEKSVEKLMELLLPRLGLSGDFTFTPWRDTAILPGEEWKEEIQRALKDCHFGLLFVSPHFFNSSYITKEELCRFIRTKNSKSKNLKYPVFVGLTDVFFHESVDLKGVEKRQIFLNEKRKFFNELTSDKLKNEFATSLCGKIFEIAKKNFTKNKDAVSPPQKKEADIEKDFSSCARDEQSYQKNWKEDILEYGIICDSGIVPPDVIQGKMEKLQPESDEHRLEALTQLELWAKDINGSPYCALLGDIGIGKTTTSRFFVQRLQEEYQNTKEGIIPVYLDLRHLGESIKKKPVLEDIINHIIAASWKGGTDAAKPSVEMIFSLVQKQRGLVVFDGLDEVLVHLSPAEGQNFFHELLKILPQNMIHKSRDGGKKTGRILFTCRTHYFRSLREQKNYFTGQERDNIKESDFTVFELLPFDESQIKQYIELTVPEKNADTIVQMLKSVHNLSEIASRPYTLSLIAKELDVIEQWQKEGKKVSAVSLYRHFARSWLERDAGKHQIALNDKIILMEYLAGELWRSSSRTWSADTLERWLIRFMSERREFSVQYDLIHQKELFKEDLRTATFVVRENEDTFRFAHTSLLEFFLASYIYRALDEGNPERLNIPRISRETYDFLGQLITESESKKNIMDSIVKVRKGYIPMVSELLFDYCLYANDHNYPSPLLAGFQLPGVDFSDRKFIYTGKAKLNVTGINLAGANLRRSVWHNVMLEKGGFTRAKMTQAEFIDSRLVDADFTGADLTAVVFRKCNLTRSVFTDSEIYKTLFLYTDTENSKDFPAFIREQGLIVGSTAGRDADISKKELQNLIGLNTSIESCVYSPDGSRIITGGLGGTVQVWDAYSGDLLLSVKTESRWVKSCVYSPDGSRIITGGLGGTVQVWDASSGDLLLSVKTESRWVKSCGYSPDGSRIITGGLGGTVQVWNASSGDLLLSVKTESSRVESCVYSPDGSRIITGGDGGTVQVWDASSGKESLYRYYPLSEERWFVLNTKEDTIQSCGSEAWRVLRWNTVNTKTGEHYILPAEYFGALPVKI